MSHDHIRMLDRSTIQIGSLNDRIYLMDLYPLDISESQVDVFFNKITQEADKVGVSKIFAKVPHKLSSHFEERGYREEAAVPGLFADDHGSFMSLYREDWRKKITNQLELDAVLHAARKKQNAPLSTKLDTEFTLKTLKERHAEELAELYKTVFATYPFPVHEAHFLKEEMRDNVCFSGIFHGSRLIAAASAEFGKNNWSAELTDFAVLPEYRKSGLGGVLLHTVEQKALSCGCKCLYTIARATSFGVNILFSKGGYTYSGTLPNNTNICGSLETMNIWYKTVG